jgi:hypothetical protein
LLEKLLEEVNSRAKNCLLCFVLEAFVGAWLGFSSSSSSSCSRSLILSERTFLGFFDFGISKDELRYCLFAGKKQVLFAAQLTFSWKAEASRNFCRHTRGTNITSWKLYLWQIWGGVDIARRTFEMMHFWKSIKLHTSQLSKKVVGFRALCASCTF